MSTAAERDEYGRGVPLHVEAALREYLKCGILAHGFASGACAGCTAMAISTTTLFMSWTAASTPAAGRATRR